MFKVFGFVTKNNNLTHDEYRAGHVGYHNSFGRRLNNIRGYTLNVRSNQNITKDYKKSSLVKKFLLTSLMSSIISGMDMGNLCLINLKTI